MNQATFKYGTGEITLSKSAQYIAIKKQPEVSTEATDRSIQMRSLPVKPDKQMDDFEVLENMTQDKAVLEDCLDTIRSLPSVAVGTHVFHTEEDEQTIPIIPTGTIYLVLNEQLCTKDCQRLLQEHHLNIVEKRGTHEFIVSITQQSKNPIKTVVALQELEVVSIAEPELLTEITLAETATTLPPTDTLVDWQWHLQNKGTHGDEEWADELFKAGADAKVVEAWEWMKGYGSDEVTVAVIDNGFDLRHPDLNAPNKIVAPWNFDGDNDQPTPAIGRVSHGTPCAGVAVGNANNAGGIVGVAPNAKLMPLRFQLTLRDSHIESWFLYALNNGADIISCSWGPTNPNFRLSTRMIKVIEKCATEGRDGKGCVIVFAAGNNSRDLTPPNINTGMLGFTNHPKVINVAASNSRDEYSIYSNFGKTVTVCAPSSSGDDRGVGIATADIMGFGDFKDNYTRSFGGTSSACPLVAGICALLLSVNPELTADEVKSVLEETGDKIGPAETYDNHQHSPYFGYGRVNARKAVEKAATYHQDQLQDDEDTPKEENPNVELVAKQLIKGQLNGNLDGDWYKISLPKQQLKIRLRSDSENEIPDFDLYVKKGSVPVLRDQEYDALSVKFGANEAIVVDNAEMGADYYVLVRSFEGKGEYELEVKLG